MLDLALDDKVILNDELDCAIQEIDIILGTENTELIGYPKFGTEFESFLWTLTPTTIELKNYITERLADSYYLSKFKLDVECKHYQGEYRSVYLVAIQLTDRATGKSQAKIYQFQ